MKFSILIPVYNVEKYIVECLDSVMAQDGADYEVIIVDDGSTDSSGRICDEYKKRYPDHISVIHKENKGLISARRVGIAHAKGEYCIFVDSDDKVKSNLLSEISQCLNQEQAPDMVLYSFQYLRDGVPAEKYPNRFMDGQTWRERDKKELYMCLLSGPEIDALFIKAIKTSILKADPIPYEKYYALNMSEDTLQSIYPLTVAKKIVFVNKPLYLYRIIDTSISHDFSVQRIEKRNTNHVYRTILEYLPIWEMDDEETHLRLDARWFNEAMYTFCKYYEAASNKREKKQILCFDWDTMIPFENRDNVYFTDNYKKIYKSMRSGHRIFLYWFFGRKILRRELRSIKGVLQGKVKKTAT